MDNEFMNEYNKQNKKSYIMLIIFIFIIVLFGVYFGGNLLIKKFDSKLVFADFFNDLFNELNNNISLYSNEFNDSNIQIENNLSLSFDTLEEMNLNEIGVNYITQLDISNNQVFMDFKYLENDEQITNLQLLYESNATYLLFKDIFDKVLKIDNENEDSDDISFEVFDKVNKDITEKDIKKFFKLTKDIVLNNIDENNFFRSKEKVTIEKVEYELDKHSYILEEKEYSEFIIGVLNDFKNNSEYINLLVKIFDFNKEDIINELDKIVEEQNNKSNNIKKEYVIYTKGLFRKVVGFGIIHTDNDERSNFRIKYFNVEDKYKLLIEEEYESFSEDNNYYVFEGKKLDDIIKLTYKENGKLISNITYKSIGNSMEVVIANPDNEDAVKIYVSSLTEDKMVNLNLSIAYSDNQNTVKLEYNSKVSLIDNILKLDNENVVDIDNLTEDDLLKIENNMMNLMSKTQLFNSLFSNGLNSSISL